jgi:hypothetical protein
VCKAITIGLGHFKHKAVCSQQAENPGYPALGLTLSRGQNVACWEEYLAQISVAKSMQEEVTSVDRLQDTAVDGSKRMQGAEWTALTVDLFSDGIKDFVNAYGLPDYRERIKIALVGGA